MRDLNYQLKQLCRRNRDGSYETRMNRERLLSLIADQLHRLGYRQMSVQSLKPKHVEALVRQWLSEEIATGTIKNRMSVLRWWAEKAGRESVVARHNEHYGIPDRCFVTTVSKAQEIDLGKLERVTDEHVRMSLELQRAFGLRREEAIKFQPSYADRGDHLLLKPSWTKGGKEREIPIRTAAQREILARAHRIAGRGSLIPSARNYRQQLRVYERHTANAGLSKLHGLRHAYAQARYEALTGWNAPAAGGPSTASLTPDQRAIDREARAVVSQELGHERERITVVYLGR
ncbi:MAG: phage integrase N-terminal domain-containing protein [Gammaproteobacteria bacterium]